MNNQKEKNFISAVVYLRNNEKNITNFIKLLEQLLSSIFDNFEIIFVNDASADNTREIIKTYCKEHHISSITIVNMSIYHGLEAAMIAGVELAIGDFVYEFDTIEVDYSSDLVFKLYKHLQTGYDIVRASPRQPIKLSSKVFYYFYNKYASSMYPLTTETFRLLSRRAINRIRSLSTTLRYRKAHYANCGLRMDIIHYEKISIDHKSKKQKKDKNRKSIAFDSLILYTTIAQKISIGVTFSLMLFSVFIALYTLFVFLNKHPIEGWTTTMLFVSIGFFGIFGILSIVIKYLTIIVELVFKERNYLVESVEKISE
ncbi:MAG: glycosyltransferase [Vallitaleaceae bacterium]|nr:glycosyltransferase [Vallitaleaceae bacterium]